QRSLHANEWVAHACAQAATASSKVVGSQEGRAAGQPRCSADKDRAVRRAKAAARLGPKGTWSSAGAQRSPDADVAPPVGRHDPTPADSATEHRNAVVSR